MTYDGSININTKIDQKGFQSGISGITNSLKGMKGILAGMGSILGFAFIGRELASLGREAIQVASDLSEVENVVNTAFGSMKQQCYDFADSAIENFGMSRLAAEKTASTYMTMARSMGVAQQDAADMSIALAGLSGDVASFYNISQDEAAKKLQSVFTGETESLKTLGIVMTQTNLEAYALANGVTKSYSAMSEAERVTLRYRYVTEKLNMAAGDFSKTSNGWANQTRILNEQFKELLSILGTGLIALLTPVVRVLNRIMGAFIKLANTLGTVLSNLFGITFEPMEGAADMVEDTADSVDSLGGALSDAADSAGDLADATGSAADAAKELNRQTMGFDRINKLANTVSKSGDSGGKGGSGSGGGGNGSNANGSMGDIASVIPARTEDVLTQTENVVGGWADRLKDLLGGIWDSYLKLLDALPDFKLPDVSFPSNWGNDAIEQTDKLRDALNGVAEDGVIRLSVTGWQDLTVIQQQFTQLQSVMQVTSITVVETGSSFREAWTHFKEWITGLPVVGSLLDLVQSNMGILGEHLKPLGDLLEDGFQALKHFNLGLDALGKGDWKTALDELHQTWDELKKCCDLKMGIKLIKDGWHTVWDWIKLSLGTAVHATIALAKSWKTVWDWIKEGWGKPSSAAVQLARSGWTTVWSWVKTYIGTPFKAKIELLKGWKGTVAKVLGLDNPSSRFSIKLPKIDVTWSGSPIKLPKFNVKWNAKGGILDSAAIFGMAGNTLFGGGEAGKEAILPLERNTGWMDALAQRITKSMGSGQPIVVQVKLDGRIVGQSVVNYVAGQTRLTGSNPLSGTI